MMLTDQSILIYAFKGKSQAFQAYIVLQAVTFMLNLLKTKDLHTSVISKRHIEVYAGSVVFQNSGKKYLKKVILSL